LIDWLARPVVEHTWPNFKQHFNAAYRELKRIRGPAMRSTAFHQAHQVAADLTQNFHQMRDDVIGTMNTLTIHQEDHQEETTSPSATPTINATTHTDTQLITAIQQLQQHLQSMSTNVSNGSNGNGRRQRRRNVSKYCWSHGASAHASPDCENKKGHKYRILQATYFFRKMDV